MTKILIVDDKPENLNLLELLLKENGYITVSAKNGAEALSLARKDFPDLIITDILMPIMDGFTLCREFKKDKKLCNVPFIFYTATYTDSKDEELALSLGADRFIVKPYDLEEFIAIVKTVLKEAKKKNIQTTETSSTPETVILKEYNEALVRKLEDKMLQTEQSEKEILKSNIKLLEEIEERKRTEELLRESEERYRALVTFSPNAIYVHFDSHVTLVNPAICQMLGANDPSQLIGKSVFDIVHPDYHKIIRERWKQVFNGQLAPLIEEKFIRLDGTFVDVEVNAVAIDWHGSKGVQVIARDITERKRAEETLSASEHLFHTLAQVSPVGIFKTNPDGYTTYVNPKWSQLSGLSFENALGDGWLSNVHPEDKEKLSMGWQESTRDRKVSYSEYRFKQPDGTIAWVMGQAIPETNSENQIVGYIGTITDITERKQTEEALAILETRYRRLFETAKDGIIILDAETGKIVDVNPFLIDLLGYSKEKFIEKEIWEIGFFKDIAANKDKFLELQQKKYVRYENLPLETADGRKINVEFVSNVYLVNNQKVIQCNIRDVTERMRVEKALLESEERYRQLVNLSPDAIVVHSDGRFVFVNPAAIKLFGGKNSKDILGKPIIEFVHPDFRNTVQNRVQQVSEGKTVQLIEEKFIQLDGTVIDVEVAALPFNFESKPSVQVVFRDITEHKRAEEALLKLKKAVDNSGEIIFLTDKKGIFTFANPAFTSIYGFTTDEIIGKVTPRILKSEFQKENDYKLFWETLISGKEVRGELINKRKDGTLINVESSSTPILDEKKNIIGFLGIQRDITKRRLAEKALRESEKKYKSIFENIQDVYYETSFDGTILEVSPSIYELTNHMYKREDVIGKSIYNFYFNSDERDTLIKKLQNHKSLVDYEIKLKNRDGTIIPCSIATKIQFNADGNPEKIIGTMHNITERKHAEEILFESESKYRTIITQSPDGIFIVDLSGSFLSVNKAMCDNLKYSEEEFLSMKIWDIVPQQFLSLHKNRLANMIKGESNKDAAEYEVKGKDGIVHFIEVLSAPHYKDKKIIGFQGIARDITERKRAEEEIVMLAHSLRSVNECVSITDMEDKIIFVNESFLMTYGFSKKELIGKHISIVQPISLVNPTTQQEILFSTLRGGWQGELLNKRKDGSEFPIYLSTTIINDKESKPLGLIGVAVDITERKHSEKELIKAKERAEQSDKLKSEFLAQMSHEIRTPLNAIVGNADYLNASFGKKMDSDARDSFNGIDLASKRIIRTIDLILNAAEIQTSGYKPLFVKVDINSEILSNLYQEHQLLAKQKKIEFIYTCTEKDTKVMADEYSITQIFANLIDNAIKYTKRGKVEILLRKNNSGNIMVEVKDTGIGISKEFLPRIFDPFVQEEQGYSRSFEGNGLGLALVKNYCEINNAIIEIESEKNVGSTFRVIFRR